MYQHKSWATFWSVLAVSLFFVSIYWNMKHVAQFEQNNFQGEFTGIQVQISGQITKGYEKGTEVVSRLNRKALDSTESISFELMDQMLIDMTDKEALTYIKAYMKDNVEAYALFSKDKFSILQISEGQPSLPTVEVLNEWTKGLKDGEAISKDSYNLVFGDGIERPRLHLFKLRSKPWILYVQIDETSKLKSAEITAEAIKERFSLLNSATSSDLVYLDDRGIVVKSSKPELVGQKLFVGKKVSLVGEAEAILHRNEAGELSTIKSEYTWIELTDGRGKVNKYIGRFVGEGAESKYFISDSNLFVEEYVTIGRNLGIGVLFNIAIALIVIHLVASNYEYFVEGRRKRGGV